MSPQRALGLIMIVVGVILVVIGINATDSVGDRLSNLFTGHFTDATVWYLVGGAMLVLGGLAVQMVRFQKPKN